MALVPKLYWLRERCQVGIVIDAIDENQKTAQVMSTLADLCGSTLALASN
jgi:hypothetical protein